MSETKNSTTKKVLRTQRRVMGWSMLVWNLLVLVLVAGFWLLWHMQQYLGGWELLDTARVTYLDLVLEQPQLRIWLTMLADGREQLWLDVTGELQVLVTGILVFWVLQLPVQWIASGIWRGCIRNHMQQVTQGIVRIAPIGIHRIPYQPLC